MGSEVVPAALDSTSELRFEVEDMWKGLLEFEDSSRGVLGVDVLCCGVGVSPPAALEAPSPRRGVEGAEEPCRGVLGALDPCCGVPLGE